MTAAATSTQRYILPLSTATVKFIPIKTGAPIKFDISRIDYDGSAFGAVILLFDITDRENAEKLRREFTANVSHELKTPPQGIIGIAELIESDMVKAADMPRFVGHIREEAQRLVSLVNDNPPFSA